MRGLTAFVKESNRIEGILREPLKSEMDAHRRLLALDFVPTEEVEAFISAVAPGHVLRRQAGHDVRVGNHIAPPGGAEIPVALAAILADLPFGDPYDVHQRYEFLHPFTDGNGRSGRALWLWMMAKGGMLDLALALGFLHNWYYASLSHHRFE